MRIYNSIVETEYIETSFLAGCCLVLTKYRFSKMHKKKYSPKSNSERLPGNLYFSLGKRGEKNADNFDLEHFDRCRLI